MLISEASLIFIHAERLAEKGGLDRLLRAKLVCKLTMTSRQVAFLGFWPQMVTISLIMRLVDYCFFNLRPVMQVVIS